MCIVGAFTYCARAVPHLTLAVALPERNSAQSLTTVPQLSTEAWEKAYSLVEEVVPDTHAPMPLLFLHIFVWGNNPFLTAGLRSIGLINQSGCRSGVNSQVIATEVHYQGIGRQRSNVERCSFRASWRDN